MAIVSVMNSLQSKIDALTGKGISGMVKAVSEQWQRFGPLPKGTYVITATGQWGYAPGHLSGPDGSNDRSTKEGSSVTNLGMLVGRVGGTSDVLKIGSRAAVLLSEDDSFVELRMWDDDGRFDDNQGEIKVLIVRQN